MIYLFTPWETKIAMDKWPIETDDLQMIYLLKNGDFPVMLKFPENLPIFSPKTWDHESNGPILCC